MTSPRPLPRRRLLQHRGHDELRLGDRGERDEEDAVLELVDQLGRDLEREPGLPGPPGPMRVTSRRSLERPEQLPSTSRPTSGPRDGQVGPVQRPSGGNAARRRAGKALGPGRSFRRCSPRRRTPSPVTSRGTLRHEHLAAVAGAAIRAARWTSCLRRPSRDQRRAVCRPDPDLRRSPRVPSSARRAPAAARLAREREKEASPSVSTSNPSRRQSSVADDASVGGERFNVPLASRLLQQARRALDVGEEQGDGAGRQLGHAR